MASNKAGCTTVSINVPTWLLDSASALAERAGLSRAGALNAAILEGLSRLHTDEILLRAIGRAFAEGCAPELPIIDGACVTWTGTLRTLTPEGIVADAERLGARSAVPNRNSGDDLTLREPTVDEAGELGDKCMRAEPRQIVDILIVGANPGHYAVHWALMFGGQLVSEDEWQQIVARGYRVGAHRCVKSPAKPAKPTVPQTFAGECVCITGDLHRITRGQAHAAIEERGGKINQGVYHETTLVVVGPRASKAKYERARKLDKRIIGAEQLFALLQGEQV